MTRRRVQACEPNDRLCIQNVVQLEKVQYPKWWRGASAVHPWTGGPLGGRPNLLSQCFLRLRQTLGSLTNQGEGSSVCDAAGGGGGGGESKRASIVLFSIYAFGVMPSSSVKIL